MRLVRFGPYSLDLDTCDLKVNGSPVHLRRQPAEILAILVRRAGDLVSRQEIIDAVWPGTTVEFDQGLNSCIRQLRRVLNDDAEAPTWIETIPRRGYRFLGEVEAQSERPQQDSQPTRKRFALGALSIGLLVATGLLAGVLRWTAWGRSEHEQVRLVVLPLVTEASDTMLTALGDLLTDELIDHLARLDPSTLGVIARTSAMHYRNSSLGARAIARELDAAYLLEGSLAREGADLRVALRLIRADRQTQLWATGLAAPYDSLFGDVSEMAGSVAAMIVPHVTLRPGGPEWEPPPAVRDRFLEARYLVSRGTGQTLAEAAERFRSVLAEAPAFAPAAAGLAEALYHTGDWASAERAARDALASDPDNVGAQMVLADIALLRDWDWTAADAGYRRALEIAPGNADAHNGYGFVLASAGRHPEALSHVELAQRLDPISPVVSGDLGYMYYWAGRPDRAVQSCGRALELAGSRPAFEECLMAAFGALGRDDSSLTHARRLAGWIARRAGTPPESLSIEALDDYWRFVLVRAKASGSGPSYRRAMAYAALGQADSAVASLVAGVRSHRDESAEDHLDVGLYVVLGIDPRFDPLRARPTFGGVMDSIGIPLAARR